jgi:glycosyltransferase involved in cell wall biosynthesis
MPALKFLLTSTFYPPYHLGGDAVHVEYLAEELAKRGHEVHVMHSVDAYQVKRGKREPLKPRAPGYGSVHIHGVKSPLSVLDPLMVYTFGNSIYVQRKFSETIKKIRPDVVHHHNISLLGYGILEKKANYLSLYTAHDYWLICPKSSLLVNEGKTCLQKHCFSCGIRSKRPPQLWRSLRPFKRAIESIDLIISPSDYVRIRIAQEVNVKSVTIPNFAPLPPSNIAPIEYSNYFLFVGTLEKHKGILNLLEVFKDLRNKLDAKLIIVGMGSLKYYIQDFIKKNSLSGSILLLGFVSREKLYSLYANTLALILPSVWAENAPLVALEALSVGSPVLASNKGGLPEILEKVNKELVFDNMERLKEKLLNFSRNRFPQSRMRDVYERNFSPEAYIKKYIEIVQSK